MTGGAKCRGVSVKPKIFFEGKSLIEHEAWLYSKVESKSKEAAKDGAAGDAAEDGRGNMGASSKEHAFPHDAQQPALVAALSALHYQGRTCEQESADQTTHTCAQEPQDKRTRVYAQLSDDSSGVCAKASEEAQEAGHARMDSSSPTKCKPDHNIAILTDAREPARGREWYVCVCVCMYVHALMMRVHESERDQLPPALSLSRAFSL